MIKNRIKKLREKFNKHNIDGYIVPKNGEFFSEYTKNDRLKFISNFTGSAGYGVILKNRNYLFVDGRYTIQAQVESANNFNIVDYKLMTLWKTNPIKEKTQKKKQWSVHRKRNIFVNARTRIRWPITPSFTQLSRLT